MLRCEHCFQRIYEVNGAKVWTCKHDPNYVAPESKKNGNISRKTIDTGSAVKTKLDWDDFCDPYTLGFLFANARIEAQVPDKAEKSFERKYSRLKGKEIEFGKNGVYKVSGNKWWYSTRVTFPDSEKLLFEIDFKIENGKVEICRNDFTWHLIEMGMDFGNLDYDSEAIEELMKDEEFAKGFIGLE